MANYQEILSFYSCITEEVLFLCTHKDKHRTLTLLSSIMHKFSSASVPQFWNSLLPGAEESSVNVTKWLTET
jgi:hypothetical protein